MEISSDICPKYDIKIYIKKKIKTFVNKKTTNNILYSWSNNNDFCLSNLIQPVVSFYYACHFSLFCIFIVHFFNRKQWQDLTDFVILSCGVSLFVTSNICADCYAASKAILAIFAYLNYERNHEIFNLLFKNIIVLFFDWLNLIY